MMLKDEVIDTTTTANSVGGQQRGKVIIGEDKVSYIVSQFLRKKEERLNDIETDNKEVEHKNQELMEQIDKIQSKLELVCGERDFEKKKTEKTKKDCEKLEKELKLLKDHEMLDLQERAEKEMGELLLEMRSLKRHNEKLEAHIMEL